MEESSLHPNDGPYESGQAAASAEAIDSKLAQLQCEYESRLMVADLRTEAVRAGMVDLDGLKLIDLSQLTLGANDRVAGAAKLMEELRRNKPWLFAASSSSSVAVAPASQPLRPKTAMEMTDEEYAAARSAMTKNHF